MTLFRPHPRAIGSARVVPSPAEMPSPWKLAWPWLFWAACGVWLAVLDMRNDEVQPAVLVLILGAAVLGFARPRAWWLWSLALAAWIPAEPLVNGALRLGLSPHVNPGTWLLPPIPALVGGLVGWGIARGVRAHGPA